MIFGELFFKGVRCTIYFDFFFCPNMINQYGGVVEDVLGRMQLKLGGWVELGINFVFEVLLESCYVFFFFFLFFFNQTY